MKTLKAIILILVLNYLVWLGVGIHLIHIYGFEAKAPIWYTIWTATVGLSGLLMGLFLILIIFTTNSKPNS